MNVSKAFKYLTCEKGINVTKRTIRRVYYEMRKIINKYFKIIYESELLGTLNGNGYYGVDESLINHYKGHQVWLLGTRDNNNNDFRVEGSFNRDTANMEAFITKHVEKGNHIITDGWVSYDFLDNFNSGYICHKHIHGNGDF
jgi:hypothetical protein